jgi:FtsZ-interacting cell division protein ZipA
MTTVLIVIAAVILVAIVVLAVFTMQRRRHLKEQFGPEYDRLVDSAGGRRVAESELRERERRHDSLDIRPLDPAARDKYVVAWVRVQERFVDDPRSAVSDAGQLLTAVMADRGYPADEDDEQRIADLSVEHSHTLNRYRSAHQVSVRADQDGASTEELRNAMVDYRALFHELLEVDETPETRDRDRVEPEVAARPDRLDSTERDGSEESAAAYEAAEPVESDASERADDEAADRRAGEGRREMTDEAQEKMADSERGRDPRTTIDDDTRRV